MSETPTPETGKPPGLMQSKTFVAAAAIVATIAVMGVVVSATNLLGGEDPATPDATKSGPYEGSVAPEEAPDQEVPRSDGSGSVCGLKASEESDFAGFDDTVDWSRVGTLEAPSFPAHGPKKTTKDGYRYCYAKSPEGAVAAGMNYVAMTGDPAVVPQLLKEMYAEGPGKKAALKSAEEGPLGSDSDSEGQMAGVRLLAYGTDRARVDVALVYAEFGPEKIASVTVDLRWEDGDWKVVTREDGEMVIPLTTSSGGLAGYVETDLADF